MLSSEARTSAARGELSGAGMAAGPQSSQPALPPGELSPHASRGGLPHAGHAAMSSAKPAAASAAGGHAGWGTHGSGSAAGEPGAARVRSRRGPTPLVPAHASRCGLAGGAGLSGGALARARARPARGEPRAPAACTGAGLPGQHGSSCALPCSALPGCGPAALGRAASSQAAAASLQAGPARAGGSPDPVPAARRAPRSAPAAAPACCPPAGPSTGRAAGAPPQPSPCPAPLRSPSSESPSEQSESYSAGSSRGPPCSRTTRPPAGGACRHAAARASARAGPAAGGACRAPSPRALAAAGRGACPPAAGAGLAAGADGVGRAASPAAPASAGHGGAPASARAGLGALPGSVHGSRSRSRSARAGLAAAAGRTWRASSFGAQLCSGRAKRPAASCARMQRAPGSLGDPTPACAAAAAPCSPAGEVGARSPSGIGSGQGFMPARPCGRRALPAPAGSRPLSSAAALLPGSGPGSGPGSEWGPEAGCGRTPAYAAVSPVSPAGAGAASAAPGQVSTPGLALAARMRCPPAPPRRPHAAASGSARAAGSGSRRPAGRASVACACARPSQAACTLPLPPAPSAWAPPAFSRAARAGDAATGCPRAAGPAAAAPDGVPPGAAALASATRACAPPGPGVMPAAVTAARRPGSAAVSADAPPARSAAWLKGKSGLRRAAYASSPSPGRGPRPCQAALRARLHSMSANGLRCAGWCERAAKPGCGPMGCACQGRACGLWHLAARAARRRGACSSGTLARAQSVKEQAALICLARPEFLANHGRQSGRGGRRTGSARARGRSRRPRSACPGATRGPRSPPARRRARVGAGRQRAARRTRLARLRRCHADTHARGRWM
jgi:hypothetical protein